MVHGDPATLSTIFDVVVKPILGDVAVKATVKAAGKFGRKNIEAKIAKALIKTQERWENECKDVEVVAIVRAMNPTIQPGFRDVLKEIAARPGNPVTSAIIQDRVELFLLPEAVSPPRKEDALRLYFEILRQELVQIEDLQKTIQAVAVLDIAKNTSISAEYTASSNDILGQILKKLPPAPIMYDAITADESTTPAPTSPSHEAEFQYDRRITSWERMGEDCAINAFRSAITNDRLYVQWLTEHEINPNEITTIDNFGTIPPSSPDLNPAWLRESIRKSSGMLTSNYDGRRLAQYSAYPVAKIQDIADMSETFLNDSFEIERLNTLVIDAQWAGKVDVAVWLKLAEKGMKVSVIRLGMDKEGICRTIDDIASYYDQVIIVGYIPFLKDVLDSLEEHMRPSKNLADLDIKILSNGELYTESFRNFIASKLHARTCDIVDVLSDRLAGVLAFETALSIRIRQLASRSVNLYRDLFGTNTGNGFPGLYQYDPRFGYFEQIGEGVYVTEKGGNPVPRWLIAGRGGTIAFGRMLEALVANDINISEELGAAHFPAAYLNMPFVYIYQTNDYSVQVLGVNIFPSTIRLGLSAVPKHITGKFMASSSGGALDLSVELKPNIVASGSIRAKIHRSIEKVLIAENPEYRARMNADPKQPLLNVRLIEKET